MSNVETSNMVDGLVHKWDLLTVEEETVALNVPVAVLLGEAVDLAELAKAHLEPTKKGGQLLPGLNAVFSSGKFTAEMLDELHELQVAATSINARLRNLEDDEESVSVEDAEALVRELRSALGFVLEDSEFNEGEHALDRLRELEAESHSHDELAVVLEGYADLASKYASELGQLGDYSGELPEQAREAAQSLRLRSAMALTGEANRKREEMKSLRDRLLSALATRMRQTRKAMRYVFRDHSEVAYKAGSEYQREAKRRSRRKAAEPPLALEL